MRSTPKPGSPEVSVVIPTRNRREPLRQAVSGALQQVGVSLEVIVVDDGSDDPGSARLAALRDPRVRMFRHPVSGGVAHARNRGIAEARGRWLAFLDDDDLWSPRKLRTQLDAARGADASFVYAASAVVDEELRLMHIEQAPAPAGLAKQLLRSNVIPGGGSGVIATTDLVRALGGFDERLSQFADWDLWITLAKNATAAACSEALVGYVVRPSSLPFSQQAATSELKRLEEKHCHEGAGTCFDQALFVEWIAFSHLRAGRRIAAASSYLRSARMRRSATGLVRAAASLVGPRARRQLRRRRPRRAARRPPWLDAYA